MIAALPYVVLAAFVNVLFSRAKSYGLSDNRTIFERLQVDDRRELDHGKLWRRRALEACLCIAAATLALYKFQWWWVVVPLSLMAYGIIAPVHRWTLNNERGLDWGYMDDLSAGGNKYDEFWWKLWMRFASDDELDLIIQTSKRLIVPVRISHKVARLAYGTEILSFLTGISLYLIKS